MRAACLALGAALVVAGCGGASAEPRSDAPVCPPGATAAEGFWSQVDVARVRELIRWHGRPWLPHPQGAEVVLRAEPGQSAAHLERLARCQARFTTDPRDPLAVSGVRVEVRRKGPAFHLRMTADDRGPAREIARRANALLASR